MSNPKAEPGRNGSNQIAPSRNGHGPGQFEAPSVNGGAFHIPGVLEAPANLIKPRAPRTIFPDDVPADSPRAFLYNAYRHEIGALRVSRWVILLLLLLAAVWASGFLPGRWWMTGGALLSALALGGTLAMLRRRDFVRFEAHDLPSVSPQKLSANDKLPVRVTGHFSVEGQYARYTALPGFYRTFATREHALLCLVRNRRFLKVAMWPPEQTGMWYMFFTPELVRSVRFGDLYFSRTASPTIAVSYEFTYVKPGRTKKQTVEETIYIACAGVADAQRILADLLVEVPATQSHAPVSTAA